MPKCHRQHSGSLRSTKELSESYASYQYCRHRGIVHASCRSDIENALRSNLRLVFEVLYIQAVKGVNSNYVSFGIVNSFLG